MITQITKDHIKDAFDQVITTLSKTKQKIDSTDNPYVLGNIQEATLDMLKALDKADKSLQSEEYRLKFKEYHKFLGNLTNEQIAKKLGLSAAEVECERNLVYG